MRGQWESAAYAGDASAAPPRADLLAVEVLVRDERLRLLAWRATVDEAVAAAEEHAERYLGGEFAYCD